MKITRICDWATNCTNGTFALPLRTLTYNVYANTNSMSPTADATALTSGTAIADGTPYVFTPTLVDIYGNKIIPASGISRQIDMSLSSITNTMFLDQHSRVGPSSVYITAPDNAELPLSSSPTQVIPTPITSVVNGIYNLSIRAYTPTANSYGMGESVSDSAAAFGFSANFNVNDTLV